MRHLNSKRKEQVIIKPHKSARKFWISCVFILMIIMVGKDWLVKTSLDVWAERISGCRVEVRSVSVRLFKPSITVKGFRIFQPEGYPEGVMAEVPLMVMDYDILGGFKRKFHSPLLVVDLQEFILIRDEAGRLNVDALTFVKNAKSKKQKTEDPVRIQIDKLNLSIGRVVYQDFSPRGAPVVKVYDVNMRNRTFRNINSGLELVAVMTLQAMAPTAVRSAATYALTSMLGVGSFPIGMVGVFLGRDSGTLEVSQSWEKVYVTAQTVLQDLGEVTVDDPERGVLKAHVQGCWVAMKITRRGDKVRIAASARKFFLPRPAVARGVLYQLSVELYNDVTYRGF